MHLVLEQFGRAEDANVVRMACDSSQIAGYLDYQLDRIAAGRFGAKHLAPQYGCRSSNSVCGCTPLPSGKPPAREGWRIVFSEDSESRRNLTTELTVDGVKFTLRGRIDRIDFHESLGRLSVLDYKTADKGTLRPKRIAAATTGSTCSFRCTGIWCGPPASGKLPNLGH